MHVLPLLLCLRLLLLCDSLLKQLALVAQKLLLQLLALNACLLQLPLPLEQ